MTPMLATDALAWIVGLCVLSVIVLLVIVIAPWRTVRREPRLDDEVQARLLLGEDPDEIDRDIAARDAHRSAPVRDLYPDEET